jgi:hypothetical protein
VCFHASCLAGASLRPGAYSLQSRKSPRTSPVLWRIWTTHSFRGCQFWKQGSKLPCGEPNGTPALSSWQRPSWKFPISSPDHHRLLAILLRLVRRMMLPAHQLHPTEWPHLLTARATHPRTTVIAESLSMATMYRAQSRRQRRIPQLCRLRSQLPLLPRCRTRLCQSTRPMAILTDIAMEDASRLAAAPEQSRLHSPAQPALSQTVDLG